jgi:hypothetical protein
VAAFPWAGLTRVSLTLNAGYCSRTLKVLEQEPDHEGGKNMRAFARSLLVLLMVGLPLGKLWSQTASTHVVTPQEYERWKKDLSNWGRWGKDDEIGALNLITPDKRREAAALVKEGFSVSLAGDADTVQAVDNPNPYEVKMLAIGNDRIAVAYHGIAHTHLDSLAHINDNGVF